MRILILAILIIAFGFLYSCDNSSKSRQGYTGTFITEDGAKFELCADSTTLIIFADSATYEGTWKAVKTDDNLEYANIEFGGYQKYFYLKDGKLYRSEREMRHNSFGTKVEYQD